MSPECFVYHATLQGPGLRAYAYRADVYCVQCGVSLVHEIAQSTAPKLPGPFVPGFNDSEQVPQPCFFPESEIEQNCARCGEFLYGGNLG